MVYSYLLHHVFRKRASGRVSDANSQDAIWWNTPLSSVRDLQEGTFSSRRQRTLREHIAWSTECHCQSQPSYQVDKRTGHRRQKDENHDFSSKLRLGSRSLEEHSSVALITHGCGVSTSPSWPPLQLFETYTLRALHPSRG